MLSVVPALRVDQAWFISTIILNRILRDAAGIIEEMFENGSMNITLKNVPDSVHRVIKREAKRKRRSLNAEIIQALKPKLPSRSGGGKGAICVSSWIDLLPLYPAR